MTPRLRRRDLGPLAAAALAAWCVPAWAQDAKEPAAKVVTVADLALQWLRRHQGADGRWDSDGFPSRCSGEVCGGPGDQLADARATGLALQFFLACGETHQAGDFKATVKEGLKYLRNVQDRDGCFGPRSGASWFAGHLAATAAVVEAFGMTQSAIFGDAAGRGVAFALAALDPTNGFRSAVRDLPPDAVTLGELALLLRSAKTAEVPDPSAPAPAAAADGSPPPARPLLDLQPAQDALVAWFAERTDPRTGDVRPEKGAAKGDAVSDADRAACGALVRIWCPADVDVARRDPVPALVAGRLAQKRPQWAPAPSGRMGFAALERRAQLLFQTGADAHLASNKALVALLVEHQRTEGCARGSFDPCDVDSGERGRVEATALCALATTTPFRYGRRLAAKPAAAVPPPTPAPAGPK